MLQLLQCESNTNVPYIAVQESIILVDVIIDPHGVILHPPTLFFLAAIDGPTKSRKIVIVLGSWDTQPTCDFTCSKYSNHTGGSINGCTRQWLVWSGLFYTFLWKILLKMDENCGYPFPEASISKHVTQWSSSQHVGTSCSAMAKNVLDMKIRGKNSKHQTSRVK